MTRTSLEEHKVGLFMTASFVLLAAVLFTVAGRDFLKEENDYYIVFSEKSVSGLAIGSEVTYRGVHAGKVTAIQFGKNFPDIRVDVALDPDIPVRSGTVAELSFNLLTGIGQIDLAGGGTHGQDLAEGSKIKVNPTALDRAQQSLGEVLDQLGPTLEAVQDLVGSDTRDLLHEDLAVARELLVAYRDLGLGLEESREAFLAEITGTLHRIEGNVQGFLGEAGPSLTRGVDELARGVDQFVAAAGDLGDAAAEFRRLVDEAEQSGTIRNVGEATRTLNRILFLNEQNLTDGLTEFAAAIRTLRELAVRLRDDPSAVLRSKPPKERVIPASPKPKEEPAEEAAEEE